MAKKIDDVFLDASLDKVATCVTITVCSAEPANFAGIAALALAAASLVGGDFTNANGDTSGRKVTTAQKASLAITANGTATHVVKDDGVNIVVTTCTSQALTSGGTVTIPAHDLEIADPL